MFGLYTEEEVSLILRSEDYVWLFARTLSREQHLPYDAQVRPEEEPCQSKVPIWSAYNSIIGEDLPVTRVSAPPLIAAPAHE